MYRFLITLLSCSVTMSLISMIYITAMPHLSKRYSAKGLYYIWLPVVIGWVFPFRPNLGRNILPFGLAQMQITQEQYNVVDERLNAIPDGAAGTFSIPVWLIAAGIWALGVAMTLTFHIWRHHRFLKLVNRWSEDITNPDMLHTLEQLKVESRIKKHVGLRLCRSISGPMLIGFIHPVILLPSTDTVEEELIFILRHELIHLKRKDLWYKTLVLLANALHWFNPFIYFMTRAINIQCEVSCDELLVKETSIQQRKLYGETLIGAVRNGARLHTALSTDFYGKGNVIKTRIFRIMDTTKKSAGIIILCLIFITVIGSGIAYASELTYTLSKNTKIINLDVKKLSEGNIICLKGPYELEEGDIVQYDITSDNNEHLYVDCIRLDTLDFGESVMYQYFSGYIMGYPDTEATIGNAMGGQYCFLVKFANLGAGNQIKGTIKIIKGEDK